MYQSDRVGKEAGTRRWRRSGAVLVTAIALGVGTLLLGTAPGALLDRWRDDRSTSVPPSATARWPVSSSSMFERSHYRQAPVNDPVSSLVLDRYLESLDGARSYFLASDIAEFERYRYQLDDAVTDRRARAGVRDLQSLPGAQPRAHAATRSRCSSTEPDFTIDETFEFDREDAPWAASRRRAERALAQARQERRAVADARRQDLARGARHPAQALRARAQAHRAGHRATTCSRIS